MYVCYFFESFWRLRSLTEAEVAPYGRVLDNAFLWQCLSNKKAGLINRYAFSAVGSRRGRGT